MAVEESKPQGMRTIPSAFTLLKAEFGFIGNREDVFRWAKAAAEEGWFDDPF